MSKKPDRWYYYANERGCLKDPDSVDAIGVGVDHEPHCSLSIDLVRFRNAAALFTMRLSVHCDEWKVFTECRDVLDLLSTKGIRSGQMTDMEPFYALRIHLEKLGYKNLGSMRH